jgi:23S rRNA (pseudouridine1915-N3)-methyltransferase
MSCFVSAFSLITKVRLQSIGTRLFTRRYLTVNIYIVGKKTTEDWIMKGVQEYETRLRVLMTIQTTYLKSNDALVMAVKNSKGIVLAMDETGKQFTSREFSKLVYKSFEDGGASINFVVGGFDGLPEEIKSNHQLISLSKMTWTHQMARLLLIEQIYRASEIYKGSNYHKD